MAVKRQESSLTPALIGQLGLLKRPERYYIFFFSLEPGHFNATVHLLFPRRCPFFRILCRAIRLAAQITIFSFSVPFLYSPPPVHLRASVLLRLQQLSFSNLRATNIFQLLLNDILEERRVERIQSLIRIVGT